MSPVPAIDLNADLGEGSPHDAELLGLVSSANIACGLHAGDAQTMQRTVRTALAAGVAIGAHPSFPDRANFGRSAMQLPADEIYALMLYQIGALQAITRAAGGQLRHVKPHGMLYNQAATDPQLADVMAAAVKAVDSQLWLVGLAGSELIRAAQRHGLTARQEVFADRAYQADGSLVPRSQPGALLDSTAAALEQSLGMIRQHRVQALTGEWIAVQADTLCLHGDGPHALAFARALRTALQQAAIQVRAG